MNMKENSLYFRNAKYFTVSGNNFYVRSQTLLYSVTTRGARIVLLQVQTVLEMGLFPTLWLRWLSQYPHFPRRILKHR